MKNILAKLLEAQGKIKPIVKTAENDFYDSNYFDINALIADVKPILSEVGIVVLQPLTELNGKPAIKTIFADPASGETMEATTPLIENPDPQKYGSIITYQRRYALTSFLCLQGEDDDGNTASGKVKSKPEPKTQPPVDESEQVIEVFNPTTAGDVCPQCQVGTMKLRKGPKGSFLGCSAYPNCKHTENIKA